MYTLSPDTQGSHEGTHLDTLSDGTTRPLVVLVQSFELFLDRFNHS